MWWGPQVYISLMSSSELLQRCPACLVRLTWIVFVMGGRTTVVLWGAASRNCEQYWTSILTKYLYFANTYIVSNILRYYVVLSISSNYMVSSFILYISLFTHGSILLKFSNYYFLSNTGYLHLVYLMAHQPLIDYSMPRIHNYVYFNVLLQSFL